MDSMIMDSMNMHECINVIGAFLVLVTMLFIMTLEKEQKEESQDNNTCYAMDDPWDNPIVLEKKQHRTRQLPSKILHKFSRLIEEMKEGIDKDKQLLCLTPHYGEKKLITKLVNSNIDNVNKLMVIRDKMYSLKKKRS